MRVDINSNGHVTSQQVATVIDSLNEEFGSLGLRIKNLTCYVRFANDFGEFIDPVQHGNEIRKTFNFRQTIDIVTDEAGEEVEGEEGTGN